MHHASTGRTREPRSGGEPGGRRAESREVADEGDRRQFAGARRLIRVEAHDAIAEGFGGDLRVAGSRRDGRGEDEHESGQGLEHGGHYNPVARQRRGLPRFACVSPRA
jgi:hypothetical protein